MINKYNRLYMLRMFPALFVVLKPIICTLLRGRSTSASTIAGIACVILVAACSRASEMLSVGVRAVNYSAEDFSYWIEDVRDPRNAIGGELVGPFSAGGTLCCYRLPKAWRPGITVKVTTRIYGKDGNPKPELAANDGKLLTLPNYSDAGKAGDLWLIRRADGTLDILSSNLQPNHTRWPGKIKGWPVPSAAYQRERLSLYIDDAEIDVKSAQESLRELRENKLEFARREWMRMSEHFPDEIRSFSGPTDEQFIAYLKRTNESDLANAKMNIQRLKDAQP